MDKKMITKEDIMNMPAGREMDVTVGFYVMDLHASPVIYPNYSTDITAAWKVVEKLDAFEIEIIRNTDKTWDCLVWTDIENWVVDCETAPLAICRAALLSSMELDNE